MGNLITRRHVLILIFLSTIETIQRNENMKSQEQFLKYLYRTLIGGLLVE